MEHDVAARGLAFDPLHRFQRDRHLLLNAGMIALMYAECIESEDANET